MMVYSSIAFPGLLSSGSSPGQNIYFPVRHHPCSVLTFRFPCCLGHPPRSSPFHRTRCSSAQDEAREGKGRRKQNIWRKENGVNAFLLENTRRYVDKALRTKNNHSSIIQLPSRMPTRGLFRPSRLPTTRRTGGGEEITSVPCPCAHLESEHNFIITIQRSDRGREAATGLTTIAFFSLAVSATNQVIEDMAVSETKRNNTQKHVHIQNVVSLYSASVRLCTINGCTHTPQEGGNIARRR